VQRYAEQLLDDASGVTSHSGITGYMVNPVRRASPWRCCATGMRAA